MAGSQTLGDLHSEMLEVACEKCGLYERYGVALLIEIHGAEHPLSDVLEHVSKGCPAKSTANNVCGAYFRGLG
jgi:hypothetical protein